MKINQRQRGVSVPWRPRKTRRVLIGVAVGAALAAGTAIAVADPVPFNCEQKLWWRGEAMRFVTRTICDGSIQVDGSWTRRRNFYGAPYWVPMTCSYSRYGGSCSGGYWRPEFDTGVEEYVVRPDNVLPDEPQHLPTGPVA